MVYNFRIGEVTKQPIAEKSKAKNHKVLALFFNQYRKRYTGMQQNFLGGLSSYIYDFKPYYARIDGAVSYIQERTDHTTTFSGTKVDDILFTLGRNFEINKRTLCTLSGLFGIPTHPVYQLKHSDFGTGQVGTGLQFDGSYKFTHRDSLILGSRYLYFIPRHAYDILHVKYKLPGSNVIDTLFAYRNIQKNHGFELGYSWGALFTSNNSSEFSEKFGSLNSMRHSFYGVYGYRFFINTISNKLLFNISYGFDQMSKLYGSKIILSFWAAWNIGF